MAEMYSGKPLFPGKTNEDQLMKIFRLLGTPSETTWPHVTEFAEWKKTWPCYPPMPLQSKLPMMDGLALDLLVRMLQYQPQLRISANIPSLHYPFNNHYL